MERDRKLYPSLVGVNVFYKVKGTELSEGDISESIKATRNKIKADLSVGELEYYPSLRIVLLAEMYNFFRNTSYFMSVRSAISMGRNRLMVMSYLEKSVDERRDNLIGYLKTLSGMTRRRDVIVSIVSYFCKTYPRKMDDFKCYLSKEEISYMK